jgi:uncharacterized protein YndB with AHSA1/START domain
MSVHHDSVTVSRNLATDVATAFGLWSDPQALARWYLPGVEGWTSSILEHHFAVGGRKYLSFGPAGEPPYQEDCRYEDIVANERIVYSMTVSNSAGRLTSSLVTVEFSAVGSATRVVVTDQIAILDGGDTAEGRRTGWGEVLDKLAAEV